MFDGLLLALDPAHLLLILAGVAGGVLIGALPGLTATMGAALLVPFTFVMEPSAGLVMLGAMYVGAMFGDAVPAVLVNVPGTPSAMATAFDGYPLSEQGKGQRAIIAACWASAVGAIIGGTALLVMSPTLAAAALAFGPPEFFWLGAFALTIMGSVAGSSFFRGLGGGLFGLLLSTVGIAPAGGTSRFTFGFYQLQGGVSLAAALIGLFAIPQLIKLAENRKQRTRISQYVPERRVFRHIWSELRRPVTLIRSSVLGTFIGVLPGSGASLAGIVSYNEAVRWSKDRTKFGKGAVEGVVSVETANNAAAPASMVPLLSLGVPGSNVAAIFLGALLFHGLEPGPSLFDDTPEIVFAFVWAMILGGIAVFILGRVMAPLLVRAIQAPVYALIPVIAALTMVGSYAVRGNMFDTYMMFVLGIVGYVLMKIGIPVAAVALGLILGPIVENGLDVSLQMAETAGIFTVFFTRPISLVLMALTVLSALWTVYSNVRRSSRTEG
ncbi:C4-dicarboxylate ABC transporter permease [Actinobacteria bacterium YIM 96077]|uniref:C4-dicarboxylate ABC transporter permease n=1 Tax=Phytoactinopolyspora halophila TaxID=1981511 RepID=A0A329QR14_9ACTN|nr:tripartite tricarboxylate transporter permease [Phytoactinopolyspora halophila]AYY12271.1 C4-dicarboxylate ABC transporter permease [Actinobacteria bacterium YIM 96077]RAW13812.1 C4-dicarboxylate ABC transporter permease [Phytoactinopolyspora halophila]